METDDGNAMSCALCQRGAREPWVPKGGTSTLTVREGFLEEVMPELGLEDA